MAMDEADTGGPLDPRAMVVTSPFARDAGIELVSYEKGRACLRLPYREKLVGNPLTRVIHGGAVTALLDHTSGFAVRTALDAPTPIATLDLRIDYMRAAEPGRAILAEAHCFKVTSSIAFVRGTAYHDPGDPIATMTGTFMLASDAGRRAGANLERSA
jgi:uncharacterized protein (TIGR00369 family)